MFQVVDDASRIAEFSKSSKMEFSEAGLLRVAKAKFLV
jgi:hypothetical protein